MGYLKILIMVGIGCLSKSLNWECRKTIWKFNCKSVLFKQEFYLQSIYERSNFNRRPNVREALLIVFYCVFFLFASDLINNFNQFLHQTSLTTSDQIHQMIWEFQEIVSATDHILSESFFRWWTFKFRSLFWDYGSWTLLFTARQLTIYN